jgi:hypothetical protein
MLRTTAPSSTCSFRSAIGSGHVVGFNVGPNEDVYLMLALGPLDYRTECNGFASFAKAIPDSAQRYRVLAMRRGDIELDVCIEGEQFNLHDVQPMRNELLLVCARSQYRSPGDFDLNARVYGRDGAFLRAFLLGDGVETVQTSRRGVAWASYFDEGVFGNCGWKVPVGASGLVAWSKTGDKVYEYEAPGGLSAIADCYALNVATDDDVWLYYYTDFPLVHLHKQSVAGTWKVPIAGSHAFAVGHDHALFAGGYGGRDLIHLIRLERDGRAKDLGQFHLQAEDGSPLKLDRVVGRGGSLHVLSEGELHELAVGDVLRKWRP